MNREDFHHRIGQNIRKHRKQAGLSISKAAKHWVLLEVGNPMSVDSLLRAAEEIKITLQNC